MLINSRTRAEISWSGRTSRHSQELSITLEFLKKRWALLLSGSIYRLMKVQTTPTSDTPARTLFTSTSMMASMLSLSSFEKPHLHDSTILGTHR